DTTDATPAERLAFGNLLRVVEVPRASSGEVRRIVTDFTYQGTPARMASEVGPYYADISLNSLPGQKIGSRKNTQDSHGNLVRIDLPDVELPDGTLQTIAAQEFAYDAHGCLTDVRVGQLHTRYVYFNDTVRGGYIHKMIEDADGVQRTTEYETDDLG